ncbi:MAG: L,D-transpeptidase family protein [Flavisolibacter sp.]
MKHLEKKQEQKKATVEEIIQRTLQDIIENNSVPNDSIKINDASKVYFLYHQNSFQPLWSDKGAFNPYGDSLFAFVSDAKSFGLFPSDYHYEQLEKLKAQLISDTASRKKKFDAYLLWAQSDLLLTAAFVQIVKDLKIGRLLADSVIRKDTSLNESFYLRHLKSFQHVSISDFASRLEPANQDYHKLRMAMQQFLLTANFQKYTYVSTTDSLQLPRLISKRLNEEDSNVAYSKMPDSTELSWAIKEYQKHKHEKKDGRITPSLISKLNNTDEEKFIKIAINLDRYKILPAMPVQYIWVNLPSYNLQVKDSDAVVLRSQTVIGKPTNKTPELTSAISNMVTYPQWHVPESIIKKEILPGLKKNAGYTISKGLSILDKDGNEVNPYTVNWSKFDHSIPYNVVQGSGDENALGVLKFNFPNKYDVYLHDTNQRYLFSKTNRALSHGCVRVRKWRELAEYLLKNDSAYTPRALPIDTLQSWLALKQKHFVPLHKQIPVFIRYFTADVKEDNLIFYEDVYGEDQRIREKIFANK